MAGGPEYDGVAALACGGELLRARHELAAPFEAAGR